MIQYEDMKIINGLASELYHSAAAKGFHDNEQSNPGRFAEYIANLHGEVSELWEAHRKGILNEQCDKKVSLTCAEEEIADIIIRTLDTAFAMGIDVAHVICLKKEYNRSRPFMHGKKC